MKVVSLISLFILGAISFAGLLAVRRRYRVRRLTIGKLASQEALLLSEIAGGSFTSHDQALDSNERIELALRSGMRRLGLDCGIITLNNSQSTRIVSLVTSEDTAPEWLQSGREVSLALTYCGLLHAGRENLAIDHASLSDWRHHSAHRDLGWETFIGTRRLLSTGDYLTVGFYDWHARDQIYGQEEKAFVAQLVSWIAAIKEAELSAVSVAKFVPDLAQSNFTGSQHVSLSQ